MTDRYGIALIDYNTEKRTLKFLNDFLLCSDIAPSIIVIIDNYEKEKKSILLENLSDLKDYKDFKIENHFLDEIDYCKKGLYKNNYDVFFIKAKYNLGYAKANNLAIRIIWSFNISCSLITNSDIVFPENRLHISRFLSSFKANDSIIAVGSDVFRIDGVRQSPCRFLSIYDRWWRGKLFWPFLKLFYSEVDESIELKKEQEVYRLIGAFFFVNNDIFWNVGGFDEHTFLYAEELILSERARKNNKIVYYIPGIKIIHEDGYTVKRESKNIYKKLKAQLQSDLYYYSKYCNVSNLTCFLTKLIVYSYCVKRHIVNWLVGR